MAVMKTFCGCFSVKSGSLFILAFDLLLFAGLVALSAYHLAVIPKWTTTFKEDEGIIKKCSNTSSSPYKDTWWCWSIQNRADVEFWTSIGVIIYAAIQLLVRVIAVYGAVSDKACPMLPAIILGFIDWLLMVAAFSTFMFIFLVYNPTNVELTSSIALIIAFVLFFALLLYLWLCLVSHYQILQEIESLARDKVHLMQDGKMYGGHDTGPDLYPGFDDDLETDRTDLTPPPAYSSPEPNRKSLDDDISEIEDIKLDTKDD